MTRIVTLIATPTSVGPVSISKGDMEAYLDVIEQALAIHLDREAIRHGLWKEYPAKDQLYQIKVKTDRVARSLEGEPTEEQCENAVQELLDIINYSVFAIRKLAAHEH